jgi:hypothetical protein
MYRKFGRLAMSDASSGKNWIDMSLRLWSNETQLAPLLASLDTVVSRLQEPGQPMGKKGPLAMRLAKRHYALLASVEGVDDADISAWCRQTINLVASHRFLVELLRTGQVEGTLWIALLGPHPAPFPNVDRAIVAVAAQHNLDVFLENYTNRGNDEELPEKLWLHKVSSSRKV